MNAETRDDRSPRAAGGTPCRYELRVRYGETDRMGIVYHAHYLVWCEAGRTELMRRAGYPYTRLEEEGFSLAVSDAALRYHAPARYDEIVAVDTTVRRVRSRAVEFDYVISETRTGTKLVTASTTLICLDPKGRVVAIPEGVRSVLENHVA